MRQLLLPIAALLVSQALLLAGHGLQLTLLPLRAAMEGFSDAEVAFTGSAYFAGFVAGCVLAPRIVRRAGHIRAFAVMASIYSAAALVFDLLPSFVSWVLLRVLTGLSIAGLYMILESWLNERATAQTRGTLLSIYTLINLTMIIAGQQLVNLADPGSSTLFAVAAILLSLAVIPVSLTTAFAPAPLQSTHIDVASVWRNAPVALAGTVASGVITGAFWSLGPVYGRQVGLETVEITLFMSSAVLGGALFQIPLGRLSDRYDRRRVLLVIALVGVLVSTAMSRIAAGADTLLLALALLWGGSSMTMYAICLAHANDHAEAGSFVAVGTAILLLHGGAGAFGGPLASALMSMAGPGGLFLFSAVIFMLFVIGTAWRLRVRARPVVDVSEPFRVVGEVTPVALEMDPRSESDHAPAEPESPLARTGSD